MKRFLTTSIFCVLFISASITGTIDSSAAEKEETSVAGSDITIEVVQVDDKIVIDGKLDDAAWAKAKPLTGRFYQHEPLDREPSSERTKLMVIQTGDVIYFGIQAYYDDVDNVFAAGMRHDTDIMRGDCVELLIDTFRDNRSCYAFVTNPLSGEQDAIISDEGADINKSWDAVWDVKSAMNSEGWATEIAIPFKSLKYTDGEIGDWGLNITRNMRYNNETTYLVPIPRGLGHSGKFKGELFANLTNIHLPKKGLNMGIQPYVRGGGTWIQEPENTSDSEMDAGFDVRYHITPQMMFDATYNTDFAQIESEEEVVNVTRFNIYLPEKRDFFLENAGLFNFSMVSSAGEHYSRDAEFILFNSRTIGIQDGKRTPLYGGAKFAGKIGKTSLGVMNIQSEKTGLDDGGMEPSTNFTAVRLKQEFKTNSYIGLMALNKQADADDFSRTVGLDGYYAFSRELYVKGSVARTLEEDDRGDDVAGDIKLELNKDWIELTTAYTTIDSLFNPEMGFVRRENIRKSNGSVRLKKWVNNRYARNFFWENSVSYTTDQENVLQTRENSSEVGLETPSGDSFSYSLNHDYEYLPFDDDIRDILIEAGDYGATYQTIGYSSNYSKPVTGSASYRWGERFDGEGRTLSLSGRLMMWKKFITEMNYTYNHLDLEHGSLYANVLSSRLTYSFTTRMYGKCYVQWNDADERVSVNLLYDYMYSPKSHIYIVYNENEAYGDNEVRDRLLMMKLTYYWSL